MQAQGRAASSLVKVNMSPRTMISSTRMVAHSKRYIFQHVLTAGKPAAAAQAGVACLWQDFCKNHRPNTSTIHPMRIKATSGAMVAMFLAGSVILLEKLSSDRFWNKKVPAESSTCGLGSY